MDVTAFEKWFNEYREDLGIMVPNYHRIQLEYAVWRQFCEVPLGTKLTVVEVGSEFRKPYLERHHYVTMNNHDPKNDPGDRPIIARPFDSPNEIGDIYSMRYDTASVDVLVCTEVFEHLERPWEAIEEVRRVLKPGGVALLTAPFLWPWHGTGTYADFWRITADGWRSLCKQFTSTVVVPLNFHPESLPFLRDMMLVEVMGREQEVRIATGYAVRAVK